MKQVASWCVWIGVLLLTIAFSDAQAFVDPPTFNPTAPNSAQPVTLSVRTGVCHAFIADGVGGAPPMRIERSPGVVDVIAPGIIAFDGFCNLPITGNSFAIRTLAPGTYQVRLFIIDASFNFLETTLVATGSVTITQGPIVQAIPTLKTGGFLMLILLTFAVAMRCLANRRSALFVVAALFASATTSAQSNEKTLMLLLSGAPGTPTAR